MSRRCAGRAPRLALLALLALLAVTRSAGTAAAQEFSYLPPGDLIDGSGEGRADAFVYVPEMRFPVEEGPAFANSQVYNKGGYQGPPGGQCDPSNYDYPWRDNYCETRQWEMPLCPAGAGHQGQDIRPATCEAGVHWAVATVDGTITNIGSYSLYLTAADGTRHEYLHMSDLQVSVGEDVTRGQRIGRVSNEFGGTATTIHLHFNLRQNVSGMGNVYLPPYTSLVAAYEALMNRPPEGSLDEVGCDGIRGWTWDPDAPDQASEVLLAFDGALGEVDAHAFVADRHRDDLCEALGSCAHGFAVDLPLGLLGKGEHVVRAYGVDAEGGAEAELEGSAMSFDCALALPDGVRRRVAGPESMAAWQLSGFWDVASAEDAAIEALPEGADLPAAPALVRADDGSPEVWLLDGAERRRVPDPEVAVAWSLDPGAALVRPATELAALPEGRPIRPRPFLVRGSGPETWLIDDPPASSGGGDGAGEAAPEAPAEGGGDDGNGNGDGDGDGDGDLEGHAACACRAAGADAGRAGSTTATAVGAAAALGAWMRRRGRRR